MERWLLVAVVICSGGMGASTDASPPWGYDLGADEYTLLARLLVAEVGTVPEPGRSDMGLSILSTVALQLQIGQMGATVYDVLSHRPEGSDYWAYPPWVTLGCEGLFDQRACHDGESLDWAYDLVFRYELGERGSCDGYYAYQSYEGGFEDCAIFYPPYHAYFHNQWLP